VPHVVPPKLNPFQPADIFTFFATGRSRFPPPLHWHLPLCSFERVPLFPSLACFPTSPEIAQSFEQGGGVFFDRIGLSPLPPPYGFETFQSTTSFNELHGKLISFNRLLLLSGGIDPLPMRAINLLSQAAEVGFFPPHRGTSCLYPTKIFHNLSLVWFLRFFQEEGPNN